MNSLSAIDRVFVSSPGWSPTQLNAPAELRGMPAILSGKRVSDHAGVSVTISPRQKTDPDAMPIPRGLFRMPEFQ
eukprot:1655101-Pyramimonas_sp.AAC.2